MDNANKERTTANSGRDERVLQAENEIRRLKDRYEMATSTAQLGVWEYDLATCKAIWDQNTKRLFGADDTIEKVPDEFWENCLHPEDKFRAIAVCETGIRERRDFAVDYRIVLPTGEIRHVRIRAGYKYDQAIGARIIGVAWDITHDVKLAEELRASKELAESNTRKIQKAHLKLEYNALHDALTRLPNRRHLDNILDRLSTQDRDDHTGQLAALHIDLDRFKEINDTLGHAAGDAILQCAGQILKSEIGEKAFISRIGGDEFIVIIENAPDVSKLSALASSIIEKLGEPFFYEGHECLYGASIGIASGEQGVISGRTLLINSDIALYRAKSEGRNRFCVFTEDMQEQVTKDKKCADDIKRGLERNEFFTVYQPQFEAARHDIIGVEALLRWRHPERGILSPHEFLRVAEDINAVAALDEIVLERALADLATWQAAGLDIPNVSVNVSARRLRDRKLVESLGKLDIPANRISFELLESIFLDGQDETVAANLAEIRRLGIGIEIDDFGTGHASIACLLKVRPKRLKIDRQLVQPVRESVELRRLLASIVDIGQALGIEVLAEGLETMEHVRILESLDCNQFQGFAFARPMEATALQDFVMTQQWRKAA